MEHNDFTSGNPTAGQTGGAGASSYGAANDVPVSAASATSASSTSETSSDKGFTDRARDIAGTAREKLADVGSSARERTGHLKDSLADSLESGAQKLRERGSQGGALAASTGSTTVAVESDGKMSQVSDRVAGGMQATADWLRDADLDGMRTSLERQVKDHPGRTLLIAVGVGYLLGKAIRK